MTVKAGRPSRDFGFANAEEVLREVRNPDRKIEFIRVLFADILGRIMDFSFPASELEAAFRDGKGFDGSSVEGFVRIEESDLIIKPDPKTFRLLPWTYRGASDDMTWREAVMFGDIITPDGKPSGADSRHVLKRALAEAKREFGFDGFFVGPEMEFFLFPNQHETRPLDEGGYFIAGRHGEVRKETLLLLKRMGVPSEYDHHEVAHGQHEIDLRYAPALDMADVVMLVRYLVKRVARTHGLYATFMPKPINGQNGSGMHVHQSLWKGGKNAFFDGRDAFGLSSAAHAYTAGLMAHARETSAVFSQWVVSYKRLILGYEAPVYVAWGQRNRSAYIRVPRYLPGKEKATRIELRSPDPGCNVYLAFALMLAAGLDGIRKKMALADPVEDNIFHMSQAQQKRLHIGNLPRDLEEAVKLMEKSELVRTTLGDHIFAKFIANKGQEIEDYRQNVGAEFDKQVSPYEIARYLPLL